MSTAAQINAFLRTDNAALRIAMQAAERALGDLESGKRAWSHAERGVTPGLAERADYDRTPAPAPKRGEAETVRRRPSAGPLRQAWDEARDALNRHIDKEEEQVLHVGMALDREAEGVAAPQLVAPVRRMVSEHASIRRKLSRVRAESRFVHPVRQEFTVLAKAFDRHVDVQERTIFPSILEGAGVMLNATPLSQSRSAADVGRSLRTNLKTSPPSPPERSFMGKVVAWFQGED